MSSAPTPATEAPRPSPLSPPLALATRVLVGLLLLGAIGVYLQNAWLADDAFITYRTVDNLVDGHGLRWNPAERVQSYTHPLWMLVFAAVYVTTQETWATALVLCGVLYLLTLLWIALRDARRADVALLCAALFLGSRSVIDFSSSGLESPLLHLLLVIFAGVVLQSSGGKDPLRAASILAALLFLCRPDSILLSLPAVLMLARSTPRAGRLRALAPGIVLLCAWELFALFYYGFPLPNTAYAKLFTDLPRSWMLGQGLRYVQVSFLHDPFGLILLPLFMLAAFWRGDARARALASGAAVYLVYVLWVGGDFMAGRFFAAPLVLGIAALARHARDWSPRIVLAGALAALLWGIAWPNSPLRTGPNHYESIPGAELFLGHGIADERGVYHEASNPLRTAGKGPMPDHTWANRGRRMRGEDSSGVVVASGVGMRPFYAGPRYHFISVNAITDPFLARLPVNRADPRRIGHLRRRIPRGYVTSLVAGESAFADEQLGRYWEKIALITQGAVFSRERLRAVVAMNLGRYDDHLTALRAEARAGGGEIPDIWEEEYEFERALRERFTPDP